MNFSVIQFVTWLFFKKNLSIGCILKTKFFLAISCDFPNNNNNNNNNNNKILCVFIFPIVLLLVFTSFTLGLMLNHLNVLSK